MLPVLRTFWNVMNGKRYYFSWQKKKEDEESKSQEPYHKLKARPIRATKWLFLQ